MATKKTRDILKVNIIETNPRQVLLAQYLRDTGNISSQLMSAADAFYYSYALGADRAVSDSAVELAVSESVLALSNQIMRLLNFHRIDRGIVLPNEFLAQCGLVWGGGFSSSPVATPQQKPVVTLPSVAKVKSPAPEPVKHSWASVLAEDCDDDDEVEQNNDKVKASIKIGGLNASQSVADFLSGTGGR
jgi:hypothetical protein